MAIQKSDVVEYVMKSPHNTNKAVLETLLDQFGVADNKTEIELLATENKVYTPQTGKVYNKVTVNVPASTPSAIDIDFNGGVGPEYVTHMVIPELYGNTFDANAWWEDTESLITPPENKIFQCLATVSTNPNENQIITTIDISSAVYYLYIIWQDEQEEQNNQNE